VKNKVAIIIFLTAAIIIDTRCQEMNAFKQGVSFGYDFSGLISKIFRSSQTSGEASVTVGSLKKFYYTVEAGMLKMNRMDSDFNYYSNGQHIKFGFDYNMYKKKKPDENNMVFVGLRYGIASLKHSVDNIIIMDRKWGNYTLPSIAETKATAQWIELVGGIRVELLRNFSMGWSGRLHILTNLNSTIKPILISGYGNGSSSMTFGFNYSMYYTIPLRKYSKE
jgi:hypothetical protein